MADPTPVGEVVVGSTRRDLLDIKKDASGNVENITGWTITVQGRSREVPSKTINHAMAILDGPNGKSTYVGWGNEVVAGDLTGASPPVRKATFIFRYKYVDGSAKVDYSPEYSIIWSLDPTVAL